MFVKTFPSFMKEEVEGPDGSLELSFHCNCLCFFFNVFLVFPIYVGRQVPVRGLPDPFISPFLF